MLYTLFKTFRPIYLHGRSYSFVALILWTRECPTMSSNSQTSRSHKSKNPRGHDKNSCWVTLTPWIGSKPQFLKILSAPSRQKRKAPSLSNCDNLQRLTLQRTPIKHSVKHEREKNNKYKNEADDDFRPFSQQLFQPAHHGLEENLFDKNEDVFISNYQSDPKPSRRHTFLEKKRIDLEMIKEKIRNLQHWHPMKRTRTLSDPEESSIFTWSRSIKRA